MARERDRGNWKENGGEVAVGVEKEKKEKASGRERKEKKEKKESGA